MLKKFTLFLTVAITLVVVRSPEISAKTTNSITDTTAVAPDSGNWTIEEDNDQMDNITNVYLQLKADSTLPLDFPYNDKFAEIDIMCRKKETLVAIHTFVPPKSDEDDYVKVRYKFDNGKPESSSYWTESTNHEAIFTSNPKTFAQKIAQSKSMIFEFTPYDAAPISVKFTTIGLNKVLPKIAKACNWH